MKLNTEYRTHRRPVNVTTRVLQDTSFVGLHAGLRKMHSMAQYDARKQYVTGYDHVEFVWVDLRGNSQFVPSAPPLPYESRDKALEAAGEEAALALSRMPPNGPALVAIMAPFEAYTWPGRDEPPVVDWQVCMGDEIKPYPGHGPKHGDPKSLDADKIAELECALTNGLPTVRIDEERYIDLEEMCQKRFDNPYRSREVIRRVLDDEPDTPPLSPPIDEDEPPPAKRARVERTRTVYLYVEVSRAAWEKVY